MVGQSKSPLHNFSENGNKNNGFPCNHCPCIVENSALNSLDSKLLESNDFITWLASNAALTIDFGIPASKATCRP